MWTSTCSHNRGPCVCINCSALLVVPLCTGRKNKLWRLIICLHNELVSSSSPRKFYHSISYFRFGMDFETTQKDWWFILKFPVKNKITQKKRIKFSSFWDFEQSEPLKFYWAGILYFCSIHNSSKIGNYSERCMLPFTPWLFLVPTDTITKRSSQKLNKSGVE